MRNKRRHLFLRAIWRAGLAMMLLLFLTTWVSAQTESTTNPEQEPSESTKSDEALPEKEKIMEIFGFAQLDSIYDFKTNNPDWFDVVRPSKLPAFTGEFGEDGHFYESVRQTRFGVKGSYPTGAGEVKYIFDFDMFGVGVDAGQTTIRLRHAYGEWRQFGGGQTESPFMDLDIFPNELDYWGPNGMLFFRNVQFRWTPMKGDNTLMVALERPGASGDAGIYADRVELQNIKARFPLPDFSASFKHSGEWGYVKVAGMLRKIEWDDLLTDQFDLSGSVTGWGISVSSNINLENNVIRLQFIDGAGVENYFNDAPVDVGLKLQPNNPVTPVTGEALGDRGYVIFLDHNWNEKFSSAVGWSRVDIDNSDGQAPEAFKSGQYAIGNLLYYPGKNIMMGAEFQYGWRENLNGFTSDDFRVQVSFKYSFSASIFGGEKP